MRKVTTFMLVSFLLAVAPLNAKAHAGGNRERNLLIATSVLAGTVVGTMFGVFADRTLLNEPRPAYGRPQAYTPAYGFGTAYLQPAIHPADPYASGYSEGYLEGLREGRRQRYYEARRLGYQAGYHAGLGY